jgi:ribosomal protein L37AE/L43A
MGESRSTPTTPQFLVGRFIRVIFEDQHPHIECSRCDEPLRHTDGEWKCSGCGTSTPHGAILAHCEQCLRILAEGRSGP